MIYFLAPAYNEAKNLPRLVKSVHESIKGKYHLIIVSDGSTDNTKQAMVRLTRDYPVTLIGYQKNKGPGYAFKFGFNWLIPKLKDSDIVITLEADNTADLNINGLIKKAKNCDVVLSSPYAPGGKLLGVSFGRVVLSYCANLLDWLIFRVENVRTYTSFNRLYRGRVLKKLKQDYRDNFIAENGFSAVVEIIIKLAKVGAKFSEFPSIIDWRNKEGKSKMKIAKTIIRHLAIYKNYFAGKYKI